VFRQAAASRIIVNANRINQGAMPDFSPPANARSSVLAGTFASGDKVMQIENDYDKEVYSGDIGYIVDVDPEVGNSRPASTGAR
jgi:exodeoxyribonuclease V alpha subunit